MGWISTCDELPDDDAYVLIYQKSYHPNIKIAWYSTESKRWMGLYPQEITHWQKLPAPPAKSVANINSHSKSE